jgi:hypothetical protein
VRSGTLTARGASPPPPIPDRQRLAPLTRMQASRASERFAYSYAQPWRAFPMLGI